MNNDERNKNGRRLSIVLTNEEYAKLIMKLNKNPEKPKINTYIRSIILDFITKKEKI